MPERRPDNFHDENGARRPAGDYEDKYGAGGVEGGWRSRNPSWGALYRMREDRRFADDFEAWRAARNAEKTARDAKS